MMTALHKFHTSRTVKETAPPPIPLARAWADLYVPSSESPLLDLSQGVPGGPPPDELRAALGISAASVAGNSYGPILGEPALRRLLAEEMKVVYGKTTDVGPNDVGLTAGCNLAFFASIMALASPGDEIILPVPWYFNHQMTLDMLGVTIVPFPLWPDKLFVPSLDECERLITSRTRGIVLVSPNNPTGAIYPPDLLASFVALAKQHGVALILDETYRDFVVPTQTCSTPHSLFDLSENGDWRENLIHLFSFSKSYAIPGQRLGAIVAAPSFLESVTTVLDSIQICPPRAPQIALSEASLIRSLRPHLIATSLALQTRHTLFREALSGSPWIVATSGGYFAFVRHPATELNSKEVCAVVARDLGVVMLPATFFAPVMTEGDNQGQGVQGLVTELEKWVRVSVANVDDLQVIEVAKRLKGYTFPLTATSAVMHSLHEGRR